MRRMKAGYPRFFIHRLVNQLFTMYSEKDCPRNRACVIFPSLAVAQRCEEFIRRHKIDADVEVHSDSTNDIYVVYFPPVSDESVLAKQFWQHTGEGISSRQADFIVRQRLPNPRLAQYDDVVSKIKDRLAKLYFGEENYDSGNVFIFPSGMSAIYNSHRSLLAAIKAEAVAVQFGFPYLDTWKILEKFSVKSVLLGKGNEDDILELERLASTEPLLGVFLEVPSNPLLLTPDLERLGHLSKKYGFPLIIDDTIGTVFNMDLLNNFCDIVVTSLTKYFSGACNVMAGCLILNPKSVYHSRLKQFLTGDRPQYSNGNHGIWIEDAVTIELNSRNFQERMLVINRNTESICDLLRAHPKVDKVYYPKYFNRRMFEKFRRLGRMGFGGLFSITFKRPEDAIKFYDSIEIAKGPSLGTNFSICCPYTLLAHYYELEFAESYGVSRYLLRFSIGLEEMEDLKAIFLRALKA